ncbi:hypothetical protein, partial [Symmachiella dynata]|uniref:hypothetical protein n=1 Tax=Symmachiella dynata TaxID=2527995 RepID=UPI0030EEBC4A
GFLRALPAPIAGGNRGYPVPISSSVAAARIPPSPSGRGDGGEGRSTFGVPFALRNILHFTGGGEAIIGWQRLPTAIGVPQAQDAAISVVPADEALLVEERTNCGFLRALPAPIAGGNRGYPRLFFILGTGRGWEPNTN